MHHLPVSLSLISRAMDTSRRRYAARGSQGSEFGGWQHIPIVGSTMGDHLRQIGPSKRSNSMSCQVVSPLSFVRFVAKSQASRVIPSRKRDVRRTSEESSQTRSTTITRSQASESVSEKVTSGSLEERKGQRVSV